MKHITSLDGINVHKYKYIYFFDDKDFFFVFSSINQTCAFSIFFVSVYFSNFVVIFFVFRIFFFFFFLVHHIYHSFFPSMYMCAIWVFVFVWLGWIDFFCLTFIVVCLISITIGFIFPFYCISIYSGYDYYDDLIIFFIGLKIKYKNVLIFWFLVAAAGADGYDDDVKRKCIPKNQFWWIEIEIFGKQK